MKMMKLVELVHRLIPACMHNVESNPPYLFEANHSKKPPAYFVRRLHDLLLACNMHDEKDQTTTASKAKHHKKNKKVSDELSLKFIIEKIHEILYGNTEVLPDQKERTALTVEMFKESPTSVHHPFRLLITFFKKMDLESKKCVADIVANLLGQMVESHMIACEYLEENLDMIDVLIKGSFDFYEPAEPRVAFLYGFMLRVSISRSQIVARHVLESERQAHVKKFLEEVQNPDFTIASYVMTTFELLLTKQRSTVANFLLNNSEWFFPRFNLELLESSQNMLTRFHALKIMENLLLSLGKDHAVMVQFLSLEQNMKIMMNMLREIETSSQLAKQKEKCATQARPRGQNNEKFVQAKRSAFKIFKLFVDNQNKTEKVVRILSLNKEKMCRFLQEFKIEEDEQFEEEKAQVIRRIEAL